MTSLEELQEKERELQEQIEALRRDKEEISSQIREKELEERNKKDVVIFIQEVSGTKVVCLAPWRPNLENLWKSATGHHFAGYERDEYGRKKSPPRGINFIPLNHWKDCKARLENLENTAIEYADGVEEEISDFLDQPFCLVDAEYITGKENSRKPVHFSVQTNKALRNFHTISRELWNIPGYGSSSSSEITIPIIEGWNLFESLEKFDDVVYTESAQSIIIEQIEKRDKLEELLEKEDSDHPDILGLTREISIPGKEDPLPWYEAMRPFQRIGIEFMLHTKGRMILGDDTGLGKTWMSLAYAEIQRKKNPSFQTICAVKPANIPGWIREIERLTGQTPVICDNQKKKQAIAYAGILGLGVEKASYVIISHDMLGTYDEKENGEKVFHWTVIFKTAEPDLLIIDEAHQIKNPSSYRSQAARMMKFIPNIIPATATPVLNRVGEFWPLLHLVDPDEFESYQGFLNKYTYDGSNPKNLDKLHKLLRTMFLRRRKTDVIDDLPAINRQRIWHKLSDHATEAYKKVLDGLYETLAEFDPYGRGGEEVSVTSVLAQIMRLKQICAADKVEHTADLAVELIDSAEGDGKVLIFSQFKGTAYAIASKLGHQAVCTVLRKDEDFHSLSPEKRDEVFSEARDDPEVKFLVTTTAAKEGHNLEFCNWVIFNDQFWTPATHDQCEGRAYGRLSNPHSIDSFYVLAEVDIEIWLQDLLDQKLRIIQETVEDVKHFSSGDSGSVAMDLIKKVQASMNVRRRR